MKGIFDYYLDISGTEAGYNELWNVNISRIFRVACKLIIQLKNFFSAAFVL